VIHDFGHLRGIDRPDMSSGIMARADDLNMNARERLDYTGEVTVVGDDPFDPDRDGDGTACEPYW
jgi:hypothetical protein